VEYAQLHSRVRQLHDEVAAACATTREWQDSLHSGAILLIAPSPDAAPELSVLLGSLPELQAFADVRSPAIADTVRLRLLTSKRLALSRV
jgi:hypothetical protein